MEKETNRDNLPYYGDLDEFFSRLFEVRDCLHFTHLRQKNERMSTHLALEEAYGGMLPIIDTLVEGYTGIYYPPNIKIEQVSAVKDPLVLAEKFYKTLQKGKGLFTDGWIISEIDELMKIFAILIYKLKYVR